jgi:Zn-dependent protease
MRWSLPLGRVRGIPLRLHVSFLLVLPLLAPAFAAQLAREVELVPDASPPGGLPMLVFGVAMVVGLFASVLIHELAHALYAISHGGRVTGITLMLIGGVTSLEEVPRRPRHEAIMAALGPLTSLVLGALLLALAMALRGHGGTALVLGVTTLGAMNVGLGIFNLLPAFPMDGGRVLRALLTPSLGAPRATKVAARVGQGFALLFGLAGLLMGNVFLLLIALFVLMGAQGESQQVQVRSVLEQLHVHALMEPPHAALSPRATLEEAANELTVLRALALPVVEEDGRVLGVLTLQRVRSVAESARGQELVATHVQAAAPLQVDDTGWDALRRLSRERLPMLPVAADGRWVGVLPEEALTRALAVAQLHRPGKSERGADWPGPKRHQPA